MTDIVKNDRTAGGAWAQVTLKAWVRIDESTVQESFAAMLNPALASLVFHEVEPAETLVLDALSASVDTSYLEGTVEGVWSYCPDCGNGPHIDPPGIEKECERCGGNWTVRVQ